jgi:hypothetical protein
MKHSNGLLYNRNRISPGGKRLGRGLNNPVLKLKK